MQELSKSQELYQNAIQIANNISSAVLQSYSQNGLAKIYLFQNNLNNAQTAIKAALQYDVPQNNHNTIALQGIISLRQGDETAARQAFKHTITQAEEILDKTPEYYETLDAKGLALSGLAICDFRLKIDDGRGAVSTPNDAPIAIGRDNLAPTVNDAIETFRKVREIAPHAGIVKQNLRLFDELAKGDTEGVLEGVRKAVEGKVD